MSYRKFLFKKEPVQGIALFRVVISALVLVNAVMLLPDLETFYSQTGIVSYASPRVFESVNLYYFLKPVFLSSQIIWGFHVLAAISLLIGFFTRTSAWIAFITVSSLHQYNPLILNSGDTVLRLMLFYLGFARSGDAWSIDRWISVRRGTGPRVPRLQMPWAQRLIQLQVAFLYFSTSFYKLDGKAWAYGEATYYTSRLWDFERFPVPYVFDHLWTIRLTTWSSLFLEFALGTLIWFRPLRIPLIFAGIALHLGIDYSMNIPLFEWIMISLLMVMLEPRQGYVLAKKIEGVFHRC